MGDPGQRPNPDDGKIIAFRRQKQPSKPVEKLSPDRERARVRSNVAALVFAAILISLGWLLVRKLGDNSRMQDCLMSGRTNCAPIAAPERSEW
jgi:hypothetical protein